jgi:serine/threonine protein kinase
MNVNGRDVAVKFIKNEDSGMRELGEVNLLKKFDHPNILMRFDELFFLPDEIGITLPLADTDLEKALETGRISDAKKEQWVYELLSGMNCIHKNGYYHCDIKAKNVLIISDRAVIADPGLMGLEILNAELCQSIASPQLLYKRVELSDIRIMINPVYRKRFTNSQSDLWALGETIYYIANGHYPIINSVSSMNNYIATNRLPIEGSFNTIIKTLMNPDPEQLNINLTILLGEEPFNGKHADYILGTVNNNIPNKNPVIFTEELKRLFNHNIGWLIGVFKDLRRAGEEMHDIVLYNAIDMLYRIYNITVGVTQPVYFFCALLTLSGKIYGKDINIYSIIGIGIRINRDQLFETEKQIVKNLDGILDRDLPIFYGVPIAKFEKWIVDNPEKYEQFNMAGLIREINES